MKTDNIIADFVSGIIFSALGFSMVFGRKKFIDALISSNKIFWDKIGYAPDEKRAVLLTNVMIPIMGAIFLAVGVILIYRVIIYFLR
ncbi:MAG: hypothetical protein ACYC9J_06540 [Sulfuricaulis sp.]